jgi:hypothetical protein
MTVEVQAGPIVEDPLTQTRRSDASRIALASEIVGPVERVDTASSQVRVLGQTVTVNADTVLDGIASLAAMRAGDIVEVFAFFDPTTGAYAATRVERESAPPTYKLRGPIARLDTAGRAFAIGGATISYAEVPTGELPGLADGVTARVELRTAPRDGRWIATRVSTPLPAIPESVVTELEGFITDFQSLARFRVDGAIVDASGPGVEFERGNGSQLGDGVQIEVKGRMRGGVLVAERVEIRRGNSGSGEPTENRQEYRVTARIESADVATQTFVLRGITVTFDSATRFDRGAPADLRAGVEVEVRGTLVGGDRLRAERIRFER